MAIWHRKSKRKLTGGLLKKNSKKKKNERGRDFIPVKIGKRKTSVIRTKGGNQKTVLMSETFANVRDSGTTRKAKIISVLKNPANPNLVRQNIITKGCIIQTELGKARVTSRPGQSGLVNCVLIEEKK